MGIRGKIIGQRYGFCSLDRNNEYLDQCEFFQAFFEQLIFRLEEHIFFR